MNNNPIGTKMSGYSEAGPFRCDKCVHWKAPHFGREGTCNHPKVIADPDVKGMVLASGCCTYFRND